MKYTILEMHTYVCMYMYTTKTKMKEKFMQLIKVAEINRFKQKFELITIKIITTMEIISDPIVRQRKHRAAYNIFSFVVIYE